MLRDDLAVVVCLHPGAHIRGGVGGCDTPPSLPENCKKSVQNSFKIVEKVGPISRPRDV